MTPEQLHRYPRRLRWPLELLCAAMVVVAMALFGRQLLRYLWTNIGLDTTLWRFVPVMSDITRWLGWGVRPQRIYELTGLLSSLLWLALALLAVLLIRNSMPAIRTSPRGMLVEFAGSWLPLPWEGFKAIKVTEDIGAERFVLLAEADRSHLTGWHRFYSLLYGMRFNPGILIFSGISDFDGLIKTLLHETDRVAQVLENVKPARLQEDASSPLFRFLLGPASFFSRGTVNEVPVPQEARVRAGTSISSNYPTRITSLLRGSALLLLVALAVRYVIYWLEFVALQFPQWQSRTPFNRLILLQGQLAAPWWVLVAAHIVVALVIALALAIRYVLPALEARAEGLAVRTFGRWHVVPWAQISAVKVTEFSEDNQIVLVQAKQGLPFLSRLHSLLYDGSFAPGVLLTSALNPFEPMLQRIVSEITRHNDMPDDPIDSPIFQNDARSALLSMAFRAAQTIDQLVEDARAQISNKVIDWPLLRRCIGPALAVALAPALLAVCDLVLDQSMLPGVRVATTFILLTLLGLLEWPLVSLVAMTLDETSGGGDEGYRPLYLYPYVQLPRLLIMTAAIIATLLAIPVLPIVLWLVAVGWSFLLTTGLWGELYDWRGGQLIAGGLLPVAFQLLVIVAYLVVLR